MNMIGIKIDGILAAALGSMEEALERQGDLVHGTLLAKCACPGRPLKVEVELVLLGFAEVSEEPLFGEEVAAAEAA